jgi:eukaryotic-like serine/threonine-protein kinase
LRSCPRCRSSYDDEIEICEADGELLVDFEDDPLIGQKIDRYEILALIGRGAMGSVYRARHNILEREVAIKVLSREYASNRVFVERFRREAKALSKLRHTNIISVYDFGVTGKGVPYLVMDYVEGTTLAAMLRQEAPFESWRTSRIARQIAAGLAEAHRAGLVHRDVKPENIFLVQEGGEEVVKILDFGIVAFEHSETSKLTITGRILGTPAYMAPEQARQQPVTAAADLYSLGVIMYEMICGRQPFEGAVGEVLVKHVMELPPPLPDYDGLSRLAMWLLEKQPENRPPNAAAVIAEIDSFVMDWSGVSNAEWLREHTPYALQLMAAAPRASSSSRGHSSPRLRSNPRNVRISQDMAASLVGDLTLDMPVSEAPTMPGNSPLDLTDCGLLEPIAVTHVPTEEEPSLEQRLEQMLGSSPDINIASFGGADAIRGTNTSFGGAGSSIGFGGHTPSGTFAPIGMLARDTEPMSTADLPKPPGTPPRAARHYPYLERPDTGSWSGKAGSLLDASRSRPDAMEARLMAPSFVTTVPSGSLPPSAPVSGWRKVGPWLALASLIISALALFAAYIIPLVG